MEVQGLEGGREGGTIGYDSLHRFASYSIYPISNAQALTRVIGFRQRSITLNFHTGIDLARSQRHRVAEARDSTSKTPPTRINGIWIQNHYVSSGDIALGRAALILSATREHHSSGE